MPIPKIIHQTFKSASLPALTKWHVARFRKKNPEYIYEFYDDQRIEDFIAREFNSHILTLYKKIQIGAAKADFFRYAILSKKGGVYLDIDSDIKGKLSDFIKETDVAVLSTERNPDLYVQWALIFEPNHPFLVKTMEIVIENLENNSFPNDVHKMTGPSAYTKAIMECIKINPDIKYRVEGTDYNGHLKFKYFLNKLLYEKGEHWKKAQTKTSVLHKTMKVAGFTFIRNAVLNDYPIVEAITSILLLCDEFIVAIGKSSDETRKLIEDIGSPKIKIIDTTWDESLKKGGAVFAAETDKAFNAISKDADWAFYIQGDEAIHEMDLPLIKKEMEICLNKKEIEGLLFKYNHFYGSYDFIAESRRWYRREIRILRRNLEVQSYRDAQGFRINGRKIKVKLIDAHINHYGWVKPPAGLVRKKQNFNTFYDENAKIEVVPETAEFDYGNADRLIAYSNTQPQVMKKRIQDANWKFNFDPTKLKRKLNLRRRLLEKFYKLTGIRLAEYKNYDRIA
ncbi:mannosyltransferase OCH1-like enzyme [Pedobacter sp. UYP24]